MLTCIRYILLCALRDRLFLGMVLGVAFAAMVASLLGGTALLEEKEMALTYAGGASRLLLAVGLIVFVCFHLRAAFDSREIDVMLSRPVSRAQLVLSYWLGFALVAALAVLPVAAALFFLKPITLGGTLVWLASLLAEAWLVVTVAMFAGLVLRSAVAAVLACLGFYVLSRLMAFFMMTADAFVPKTALMLIMKQTLTAISSLVPRLDFFAASEWLAYGAPPLQEIARFAMQAGIFIPLLLVAAVLDFRRKQF